MQTANFTDCRNLTWTLVFSLPALLEIEKRCKVRIRNEQQVDKFAAAISDRETLATMLLILVSKQMAEAGVSDNEFFDGLDGDTFTAAEEAIVQAFIAYCPARVRDALNEAFAKFNAAREYAAKAASDAIKSVDMDAQIRKVIDDEIEKVKQSFATGLSA